MFRALLVAILGLALVSASITTEPVQSKPVVVMYWTTYCPYCKNQIPVLNELVRSQKATVIGVCMDRKGNKDKIDYIIRTYKPNFNIDGKYKKPGPVWGVPTIFIIKDGKVVKVFHRSTNPGEIDRYL